ncbi:class I SAM-dependent methyltransferase [Vibrio breoganii]|uniref:class I SAM-dependent methyltransferase n=1 Tax=Vibrio breoganii TaxID=553239 RepID=UPI000C8414E5|nr:class I SAM-dependent methyltransferase [Vibrio breoganii]PMG31662.1 SAM-dependent methyltransferase [Vibrio breoganii]PMG94790.1 SAM-dependent methyltransferase [Vibrio breoganii]PMG94845.1 SAM-dependent methyltransferase [Vibrio breoganii]PMM10522.1 SAM-dependent methyltransferase [Vibrio breoganii]TKG21793.1 class I SAM-dependent methyltransferase [Vibrio breoganii]
MNSTTQYYNHNAQQFFDSTIDVEMQSLYEKFLPLIPTGGRILDAGCGSGRDSKAFLDKGFQVDAFDASAELTKLATELTGLEVTQTTFLEFQSEPATYDGIWACASLLHVPEEELSPTFLHLSNYLKPSGVMYCSFKLGDSELDRNGRFFRDLNLEQLENALETTHVLKVKRWWETSDLRPGRENEKWLNAVLEKY